MNNIIKDKIIKKDGIWYGRGKGYWSNLEQSKNEEYLKNLVLLGAEKTVDKYFPQHRDVIFSLKRSGGLATMEFREGETILDAGCMWGALSIPLARTKANVVAIDQTEESLRLLRSRRDTEELKNLQLVCADLKLTNFNEHVFDKIIINGVLEWIAEEESIEVHKFIKRGANFGHNVRRLLIHNEADKPIEKQRLFLKRMHLALKNNGCLYLAIENRYNLFYLLGLPEEHCGIRFISLFPRFIQNIVSTMFRGRKYRTWTYSKKSLKKLLYSAGFSRVDIFFAFPDYREPDFVLSSKKGMNFFRYCKSVGKKPVYKKIILRLMEEVIYKRLRCTFFAPSFIIHAYKR